MQPTKPRLRLEQPNRAFQSHHLWLIFLLSAITLSTLAQFDLPLTFKGYLLLLPVQLAALGYGLYWRRRPRL